MLLAFLQLATYAKVIQYSFNEQCKIATQIFTGRVLNITVVKERNDDWGHFITYEILFVTSKAWKGFVNDTISCIASEGFCSPNIFVLGNSYLVYSTNGRIELGSGRSGNIDFRFVKSDIRNLTIRYLFRRPSKIYLVKQ